VKKPLQWGASHSNDYERDGLGQSRGRASTRVVMRWRRGELLGKGASGSVFVALQPDTGALLAVKEVDMAKLSPEAMKDIYKELETLR
jgi:L-asparaginase II